MSNLNEDERLDIFEESEKEMLEVVKKHKVRLYDLPKGPSKKGVFRALSYGGWAIDELLVCIYERRPMDVSASINEFLTCMDVLLLDAKTEKAKDIYLSAIDAVNYIKDELIMLGYFV